MQSIIAALTDLLPPGFVQNHPPARVATTGTRQSERHNAVIGFVYDTHSGCRDSRSGHPRCPKGSVSSLRNSKESEQAPQLKRREPLRPAHLSEGAFVSSRSSPLVPAFTSNLTSN